jgi:hypothetical protein
VELTLGLHRTTWYWRCIISTFPTHPSFFPFLLSPILIPLPSFISFILPNILFSCCLTYLARFYNTKCCVLYHVVLNVFLVYMMYNVPCTCCLVPTLVPLSGLDPNVLFIGFDFCSTDITLSLSPSFPPLSTARYIAWS